MWGVEHLKVIRKPGSQQEGFSLIEVLIAVLILAIGLLGVAGVQYLSMQRTTDANLRSHANLQVQSIADTIRVTGTFDQDAVNEVVEAELGEDASVTATENSGEWTITLAWENQAGETDTVVARLRRR